MFTGLIEDMGKIVQKSAKNHESFLFEVMPNNSSFLKEVKIGDSISIDGACQTVTEIKDRTFTFYSTWETVKMTTFASLKQGDTVNLEKALKIGDRLDGHFVYGHVEGVGKISSCYQKGEAFLLQIEVPQSLKEFIVPKGSISINGISLTISKVVNRHFEIAVIPLTYEKTNLKELKIGQQVNLETDILLKYAHSLLNKNQSIYKNLE